MSMSKDRHKGEKIQFYINDDELARLDRLTVGCETHKKRFLEVMEIAEKSVSLQKEKDEKIKTLKEQQAKLLDDARNRIDENEEIKNLRSRLGDAELHIKKSELEHCIPKAKPLILKETLNKLEKNLDCIDMMLPSIIDVTTEINALVSNSNINGEHPI